MSELVRAQSAVPDLSKCLPTETVAASSGGVSGHIVAEGGGSGAFPKEYDVWAMLSTRPDSS